MDQDEHLWEKIKTAKAHLFTQTNFLDRYGSTGMNVHNKSHPLDGTGPSENHNGEAAAKSLRLPSVVVTGPSPSPTELPHHGLSSETPPQDKQADQGDTPHLCSRGTQTPRSLTETERNPDGETSSEATSSPSTVVPVALPSSSTKKQPLSSHQAPQDISKNVSLSKNTPNFVKAKHSATSQEAASRPINRKSGTDSSDEVILRNGRFRASSGQWAVGTQSRETSDQGAWSIQRGGYSSSKQGRTDSRSNVLDPKELGLQGVGVSPRLAFANDSLSRGKLSSAKKDPAQDVPMSPKEELEMLQKQILVNAHMNRFREFDTPSINPEVLAKARDGPGTDPNSEVYCEFMRRAAPQGTSSSSMSSAGAQSASGESKASHEGTWIDLHAASRVSYSESPAIYPAVENGQMVLLSEPTPEVQLLIKVIGQEFGLGIDNEDLIQADQAPENNWGDPFYADWEFCPSACSNFSAFRDWFRRWLDGIVQICSYTDVYHQAFFDGTAHSDGMKSFVISDFDVPTTRLDVSDEETRLHSHETVEGYCHNWAVHIKREEEEKKIRKARARADYIESTKDKPVASPRTSRPNYYLRPVEFDDIPELLVIMNWFIKNSTLTVNMSLLEAEHVRERIETAKREMLPFLVAAERRPVHSRDNHSKGLLGYAFATDTAGDRTATRFTAELEVFVLEEHRQRGVGKCLLDKLVEVCDPTYFIKGGYYFDPNLEDRPGYRADGRRCLARLLFIISVPNNEREQYKWLQEWLERDYDFEQQGLLKGTRVKFNRFLSSSYMVRNVGCVDKDTFRN